MGLTVVTSDLPMVDLYLPRVILLFTKVISDLAVVDLDLPRSILLLPVVISDLPMVDLDLTRVILLFTMVISGFSMVKLDLTRGISHKNQLIQLQSVSIRIAWKYGCLFYKVQVFSVLFFLFSVMGQKHFCT